MLAPRFSLSLSLSAFSLSLSLSLCLLGFQVSVLLSPLFNDEMLDALSLFEALCVCFCVTPAGGGRPRIVSEKRAVVKDQLPPTVGSPTLGPL